MFGARLIPNRNAAQPNEAKIEGNFRHRENFVETGLETHSDAQIHVHLLLKIWVKYLWFDFIWNQKQMKNLFLCSNLQFSIMNFCGLKIWKVSLNFKF